MNNGKTLAAERLRELLSYDPETGIFKRIAAASPQTEHLVGRPVGSINKQDGYVVIHIGGVTHRAHRLAWLYVHGQWPECEIDHINRVRDDNRIANLRSVSHEQNAQNVVKPMPSSKSGIRGVSWSNARQRWAASISVNNKVRSLGRHMTQQAAHAAYLEARKEFHAGFIA